MIHVFTIFSFIYDISKPNQHYLLCKTYIRLSDLYFKGQIDACRISTIQRSLLFVMICYPVIQGTLVWSSDEEKFISYSWSHILNLIVICLSPLIQKSCGTISSRSIVEKLVITVVLSRKPNWWISNVDMTKKDQISIKLQKNKRANRLYY